MRLPIRMLHHFLLVQFHPQAGFIRNLEIAIFNLRHAAHDLPAPRGQEIVEALLYQEIGQRSVYMSVYSSIHRALRLMARHKSLISLSYGSNFLTPGDTSHVKRLRLDNVDSAILQHIHEIAPAIQHLTRCHRDFDRPRYSSQRAHILGLDRCFKPHWIEFFQGMTDPDGRAHAESVVAFHQDVNVLAHGIAHRLNDLDGKPFRLSANKPIRAAKRIELKRSIPHFHHLFCPLSKENRISRPLVPPIRISPQFLMSLTAQKLPDGSVQHLANNIPAGDLDSAHTDVGIQEQRLIHGIVYLLRVSGIHSHKNAAQFIYLFHHRRGIKTASCLRHASYAFISV